MIYKYKKDLTKKNHQTFDLQYLNALRIKLLNLLYKTGLEIERESLFFLPSFSFLRYSYSFQLFGYSIAMGRPGKNAVKVTKTETTSTSSPLKESTSNMANRGVINNLDRTIKIIMI